MPLLLSLLLPLIASAGAGDKEKSILLPSFLNLIQEPLLTPSHSKGVTQVRCVVDVTFENPISVRAYLAPTGPRIRVARLSGKGGFDLGTLAEEHERELALVHWQKIVELSSVYPRKNPFPQFTDQQREALMSPDGVAWILERHKDGVYQSAAIANPDMLVETKKPLMYPLPAGLPDVSAFVACCRYLLQFAPAKWVVE